MQNGQLYQQVLWEPLPSEKQAVAYPNDNGQQERWFETQPSYYKKNSQSKWSTNTSDFKRQSDDGKNKQNPELMTIYQNHQMEERPYLQEDFVTYLRKQTTIKELAEKTTIKKQR